MIQSGAMKLLGAFALAAIGSAAWGGRAPAAHADDSWTRLHPWHLECRFLLNDKGSTHVCHAAADLCHLAHAEITTPEDRQECADILRAECDGSKLFEGLAIHSENGDYEVVSAEDGAGKAMLPQLSYSSDLPDRRDFLIDAWLATDLGRSEGFCRVHGNAPQL